VAEKISVTKNFTSTTFDTYVPELTDNANIQDAFELFYYGNSDTGDTEGTVSLHKNLVAFNNRITSTETSISDATGGVVGATKTQTLTNKTLTSPNITGTSSIQEMQEFITVAATATSGSINYNILTNHSILFHTANATGNFSINFRGDASNTLNSILSVGETMTIAFLVTNGATAFYQTGLLIDGVSVTPKWQNGSTPTSGNINSIDIYSYTIIKTASATYTVLASQTKFS
jgi:hypothetical protein